MKKIILLFIAIFCISTSNNILANTNSKTTNVAAPESYNSYYIKKECFAANSKSAFEELTKACVRQNQQTIMTMIMQGSVVVLSSGTNIEMVKYGVAKCYIKVLSGSYKGIHLYVATDFVGNR